MLKGEATVSLIKLTASALVTGAVASPFAGLFGSYVNTPVWGVPVSIIGAAAFGAGLSLFFGEPLVSRRSLYGQTLAATFFGTAGAVLIADGMEWAWAQKNIAMFAMVTAAVTRWWLPSIIERGKQTIKEYRLPTRKKPSDGDPS